MFGRDSDSGSDSDCDSDYYKTHEDISNDELVSIMTSGFESPLDSPPSSPIKTKKKKKKKDDFDIYDKIQKGIQKEIQKREQVIEKSVNKGGKKIKNDEISFSNYSNDGSNVFLLSNRNNNSEFNELDENEFRDDENNMQHDIFNKSYSDEEEDEVDEDDEGFDNDGDDDEEEVFIKNKYGGSLERKENNLGSNRVRKRIKKPLPKKKGKTVDIKSICMDPVLPDDGLMKCFIIRDKGRFKMFPRYYLYMDTEESTNENEKGLFLMCAKRRKKNKTSNYCVCTDKNDLTRKSNSYIGKLRSNMFGTRFYIYDNGVRDSVVLLGGVVNNNNTVNKKIRKQLGAILYETNILGTRGPRKMTVVIPKCDNNNNYKSFIDRKNNKLIDTYLKNSDWSDIVIYKNKGPSWNDTLKAYVLNFNGRVTKPSVKNFQLVNPQKNDIVQLQFGRVSQNKFTLDFAHPLSPFQAFCVALSAFDMKLACE